MEPTIEELLFKFDRQHATTCLLDYDTINAVSCTSSKQYLAVGHILNKEANRSPVDVVKITRFLEEGKTYTLLVSASEMHLQLPSTMSTNP